MSQISSINFKKSNPIQTRHNDRDLPPSYLIGGVNEFNHNHKEALTLRNQIIENAKEAYTKHTGQKFQAKSYEWSAVVNLKPDSTMADLEKLANHFSDKYGFQCYQIAIHRDEGHIDESGNKIINHHAHMEFVTLDEKTGKNRQREIKPKALRQMQDEVAEILQMQRGIDKRISKRERIEPRKYAQMKEAEKENIKALKSKLAEKEKAQTQEQKTKLKFTSDINEIIYLNVPYNEKDEAKNLGAKWDNDKKKWYIPQVDSIPFDKWLPPQFKTKSQEIKELKAELVNLKTIKAEFETLRKEMIKWGFCDKDDYKIRTDLLNQALENAKKKQFTQDDLNQAVTESKTAILERHKAEIKALESKNNDLEAKIKEQNEALNSEKSKISTLISQINDFNQKQGDSIPKEEFEYLKAKYDANLIENENLKAEVDLLENFITPIKEFVASSLENCQNNIENNKFNAENNTKGQARANCVSEVEKNNKQMKELIENYSFFERYFSFEPYKELYEKTKEWIAEKCRKWDLTRDRGMSR